MRKAFLFLFVICMMLALTVPAFADVMPPTFFQATVGDKPVARYSLEYNEDGDPTALVEDGVFHPGEQIKVTNVIMVNGTKYGGYTTWNDVDEPVTNEYGVRLNNWKTYYFLLEDVLSPSELKEADARFKSADVLRLPIITQTQTSTTLTVTETQTETTAPPTQPPTTERTTTAVAAADADTADETLTVTETETQSSEAQKEQTDAQETTAPHESTDDSQGNTTKILPVCIAAAVILGLTAAVTLVLIRRKKQDIQNESRKEEEQ